MVGRASAPSDSTENGCLATCFAYPGRFGPGSGPDAADYLRIATTVLPAVTEDGRLFCTPAGQLRSDMASSTVTREAGSLTRS